MKRHVGKISLCLVLTLILACFSLGGCGGASGKAEENNPYEGKWVAVSAQMMGMSVSVEESFGDAFEFEVKNKGKISFTVGDETGKGKWSLNGDQFTLKIEGEDMVGTIGDNAITFDDMLGTGIKVIFAKDGTDAMNPDLYLTEDESKVIGEWVSESVEELLGDGPQTSMEGVDDIHDALRLNFTGDRSVAVIYKGQAIGTFPWTVSLGYCSIDSEKPVLSVTINEDGTLEVDYSDDDDYYTFQLVKNDGSLKTAGEDMEETGGETGGETGELNDESAESGEDADYGKSNADATGVVDFDTLKTGFAWLEHETGSEGDYKRPVYEKIKENLGNVDGKKVHESSWRSDYHVYRWQTEDDAEFLLLSFKVQTDGSETWNSSSWSSGLKD